MADSNWKVFPIVEQINISAMYSLFKVHYPEGFVFQGESHNFWECLYVMSGEVCVSADERVYNLTRGEIIFHKPLEFHKFIVTSTDGANLLVFSFDAAGPLTDWMRDKVFTLSSQQKTILKSLLSYIHGSLLALNQPDNDFRSYLKPFAKLPHYSQQIAIYLYQLFLSLADEGVISPTSSAPDAVTFSQAVRYLNENLHRQPSVNEIARHCSTSISSLKRIFEKYAGISVHKYLIKLKMKAASEMLQKESVYTVSTQLGFNSQSYFSKAFKRETGINPSEFRQS